MTPNSFELLKTPVQYLKGVGPYLASLFEKMGVKTLEDLLYHIPHRYLDRQKVFSILELPLGSDCVFQGEVIAFGESRLGRRGRKIFQAIFSDGSGHIQAKWFNYRLAYLEKQFKKGRKAWISGKVELYHREKQIIHPDLEWWEEGEEMDPSPSEFSGGIIPIYPLTEGLRQKSLRKIIQGALDKALPYLSETLPKSLLKKHGLMDFGKAIEEIHRPSGENDLEALDQRRSKPHQRIIFDEFFFLQLGLALKRQGHLQEEGVSIPPRPETLNRFLKTLPFSLTAAQTRAIGEISEDLSRSLPMHRLLQGDVGSGKTVVAVALAFLVISEGHQVCLMAPTEILAEQHERTFSRFLKPFGLRHTLLKSDLPSAERAERLLQISRGEIQLVVGTHALLQEDVQFSSLALAIIDEQHRFGVLQRASLKQKGRNPHLMVMTATPIPRTLAMTVYGDLDVSVLNELPQGRKPVETRMFSEKDAFRIFQFIRQEVKKGRQAYIVYPLVEESEALDLKNATQMYERIKTEVFPEFQVGLLHGQLKSDQKDQVMEDFLKNKVQILVATTVIEVGVDVPNATLMVVEHAERFGLSQLHQLRGRVGRGGEKSYCFLVAGWPRSDTAHERLKAMCETTDGFKIAEADLNLRGPGDFMGTRQAGLPDFRIANLIRDLPLLEQARQEAFRWVEKDPRLTEPDSQILKAILMHRWKGRLNLAQIA